MIDAVRTAVRLPDLRNKLLWTFFILVVYRLAAHIPLPGVDRIALEQLFREHTLLGLLNIFSGGALANFSVMAMGVYPYITASIIMQLLVPIVPQLQALQKEGEQGRNQINKYTHWLTVPLAVLQAWGQGVLLSRAGVLPGFGFGPGQFLESFAIIISLTAGTMFALWLGERLTEQGIGNGVSLIIFAGIVAGIPQQVGQLYAQGLDQLLLFSVITALTVIVIVVVHEGQRRIPVQYGKRVRSMRGNRLQMVGGQSTHVPMRVNSAGMIPLIFAQSLLIFPNTVASYMMTEPGFIGSAATWAYNTFEPGNWVYWMLYFFLTIGFTYFYTDVMFRQQNLPDVLQRQGGFIPGIRPGRRTEEYLNGVLSRITLVGALFLGFIAILPFLIGLVFGQGALGGHQTLILTSTGLLIVVGVVLNTMQQLEAQLLMRQYEGFIR